MTIISDDPKDQTKKELRMRNYILHGLPVVILLIIIAWMTYGRKSMEKRLRTQVVECHHRLMTLRTYTTKRQIECAGQQLKKDSIAPAPSPSTSPAEQRPWHFVQQLHSVGTNFGCGQRCPLRGPDKTSCLLPGQLQSSLHCQLRCTVTLFCPPAAKQLACSTLL